ncbi:MAG TPA: AMP-binding protein [Desertimonas sp.]|nr:AMP-binding protein [Desertimonas sp.]
MYPGSHAADRGAQAAVIWAPTGAVTTFAELDAAANRLSRLLRSLGVAPGDHVALCMENHPRYVEVLWGCHYAGTVYTAASSRLTSGELAYVVDDCGATVLITTRHQAEQAADIVTTTPSVRARLMLDGTIAGHDSYDDGVDSQDTAPLDARVAGTDMLYSSGTTGRPKGVSVELGSGPLETTPSSVTQLLQLLFGFTADDVYLSPAPLYHAAALCFTMSATALGGTAVVMDRFDAEEFLALVERYQVTFAQVVPTMFVRMLKLPAEVRASYDVSSLRCVIHAAAPCPVPVKQAMIDWFGPILVEYYGATEGNGFTWCDSEQWMAHPGTVGAPIFGTLLILDDDGKEVPTGETGTVWFEGATNFTYYHDEAKTAESRDETGQRSTVGDVGYVDDDGYLHLTDRKTYMIISGGVNIYPQEAENLLVTHDKVLDAAVIGVPNEDLGEEVKAVVQLMPGVEPGPEMERELLDFCAEHLARFKVPRSVDFEDELPRLPTGKLYKRLLRDRYWGDSTSRIV